MTTAIPLSFLADTPKSIKTLRHSYRDRTKPSNIERLTAELTGLNDRATIILLATHLDEALTAYLAKRLCFKATSDQIATIFRFEGPLGTFSARMEIGVLFGFIPDSLYAALDIFRELRNACAHSKHSISLADPTLWNVARRLLPPDNKTGDKPEIRRTALMLAATLIIAIFVNLMERDAGRLPSPSKPI